MTEGPRPAVGAGPRASPASAARQHARPAVHLLSTAPEVQGGPSECVSQGPHGLQSCVVSVHRCREQTCPQPAEQKGFRAGRERPQPHRTSKRHRRARKQPVKGHARRVGKILLLPSRCPWGGCQTLRRPFGRTRPRPLSCPLPSRRMGIWDFCFLFFSIKPWWHRPCGVESRHRSRLLRWFGWPGEGGGAGLPLSRPESLALTVIIWDLTLEKKRHNPLRLSRHATRSRK